MGNCLVCSPCLRRCPLCEEAVRPAELTNSLFALVPSSCQCLPPSGEPIHTSTLERSRRVGHLPLHVKGGLTVYLSCRQALVGKLDNPSYPPRRRKSNVWKDAVGQAVDPYTADEA